MRSFRTILASLILLSLLSLPATVESQAANLPAAKSTKSSAQVLVESMTPEERIGQLFLVTFNGSSADEGSQIHTLITQHHIGGIVLLNENDNFVEGDTSVESAYDLIYHLQTNEWKASTESIIDPETGGPFTYQYIPLFIGISQPGGGGPEDQILDGLSHLPNEMAIGATWDSRLAEQVGIIAGDELSKMGVNLILGPSLDVLESPEATLGNGLGAGVFGGDPFWVAKLGQAYIKGLHTGSDGKMMVIARNFPGRGSSDRPAGEEPATVRKPLEALKQIELAPFFVVTGNAPDMLSRVDGLLVSHIRYQGFQGNIRATTKPVSFDSQALSQILSLPEFSTWSEAGGLLVSDDLGSETVKRFYDPSGSSFIGRLVARDAFLAGNDLLYLGNIQSSDKADTYESVLGILAFFTQKYNEDTAFAQRVDHAVERILAAKLRIYGEFQLSDVIPDKSDLETVGGSEEITFEIASHAATLVSPDVLDLETLIPAAPDNAAKMVFITDTRSVSQCTSCADTPMLAVNEMQNEVLRLYGIQAGGEISTSRLSSYSLDSLIPILEGGEGDIALESVIRGANWLVINILDANPGEAQTDILRRFLSERQDLLRSKYVILFAFDAPYYLDSTDISKLTAYYCLYSKANPFVEVAVRILFQELAPEGSLPVSVPGVGYDLFTALTPDPDQIITLSLHVPSNPISTDDTTTEDSTPEATATQEFRVGDSVTVRTGILIDRNGNPVPDGTEVSFTLSRNNNTVLLQRVDATTTDGFARASFKIDTPGLQEIRASSEPATISVTLQMDVSGEGFSVTVLAPTPANQATSTPETNPGQEDGVTPIEAGMPGFAGWIIMVLILGISLPLVYFLSRKNESLRWRWRWCLCTAGGIVISYFYLVLRLPGSVSFLTISRYPGLIGVLIIGALGGIGAGYTWWKIHKR